jgi:hypothetical protein
MKATRHNGRSGKHGTYDAKHNDRRFDVENSEYIDAERTKMNVYWDCYQGYSLQNDKDERARFTFTEIEKAYYVEKYSDHVDGQNERNRKARHYDRVKTIDAILENNKTCPEETLLQLGNMDGAVWFTDDLKKLDDENVFRKMQGHLIIELSEMIATASARSIEDIKSFISRQSDIYKVPYETQPKDRPRQCVFGGTSNAMDTLPLDRTGNRRFMPVMVYPERAECHILDNEALSREYIEQVWAEAMEIFRSEDFKLMLGKESSDYLKEYQKQFMPEDADAGMILAFLDNFKGDRVCSKILDDEKASREYIDQMWAEAMVIYKSGDFQLKLPKKIEEELREYQKQFMQEDTKKELILDYLEHCQANMVCSRQLYAEALGNDGNPAQWEIREINDIMNNCSDWIAFSNPRHFPEPYRRQKGWEKPDNKGQDFQPITKEQMEQLSLPAEWMQ